MIGPTGPPGFLDDLIAAQRVLEEAPAHPGADLHLAQHPFGRRILRHGRQRIAATPFLWLDTQRGALRGGRSGYVAEAVCS